MGFGSALAGATRFETLGATTGSGTSVTPGALGYGSYVTLGTTSFQWDGFVVHTCGNGNAGTTFSLRIAIGGSQQVVAQHLPGNPNGPFIVTVPVRVPSGATVAVGAAGVTTTAIRAMITGYAGDGRLAKGFSRLVPLTDMGNIPNPAQQMPLTGTTQTTWLQIAASTSDPVGGIYFAVIKQDGTGSSTTNSRVLWDIGWGPSGSEQVLLRIQNNPGTFNFHALPVVGPFPAYIPKGTRLAVRAQANLSDSNSLSPYVAGLVP